MGGATWRDAEEIMRKGWYFGPMRFQYGRGYTTLYRNNEEHRAVEKQSCDNGSSKRSIVT